MPTRNAILRAIVEGTSDVVFVKDADGRYLLINAAGAELYGRSSEEIVGRTDAEVLPDETAYQFREHDAAVMALGEPQVYEEVFGANSRRRVLLATKAPYRDPEGQVIGVVGIARDITERERARVRATFLAEASAVLDTSLDYTTTLRNVAQLAVPDVADWCAVDMLGAEGTVDHVALAHADPQKLALVEELRQDYPSDPDAGHGVGRVLRTGESLLYPHVPAELIAQVTRDERHAELLESLDVCSAMAVPMRARGRTIGVITFASSDPERLYGAEDLSLAEELGRRAGIAVDNARLYGERSYIARTLQRSLLPPVLPDIDGLEVAARFHAAGEGFEVGGDFYDLFETAPGRWGIVIGDVCGKGADAAAVTALARYTLRATAMHEPKPSRVLASLNDAMLRDPGRDESRFCTVAYAALALRGGGAELEVSSGGHPLPLVLRADGAVNRLGASGTLLGVVPDVELWDHQDALEPGDTLVLYTDGVVEARGERPELGEEGLASVLAGARGANADEIVSRIEQAALDAYGGVAGDDIAVLALRAVP